MLQKREHARHAGHHETMVDRHQDRAETGCDRQLRDAHAVPAAWIRVGVVRVIRNEHARSDILP